jgi:DNA-binding transcriptional LysR family regulator
MKNELSLDDLSLFLAVCEAGGLTGAVAETGQSAPTLSRKMAALEKATGRPLFIRGNKGYALTAEGRELRAEAEGLTGIRRRLQAFSVAARTPRVRITSGTWNAHYMARNLSKFWTLGDAWVPEFIASMAVLDIARREADIGIRNRRPEQPWLAGRKIRVVEYAEYGVSEDVEGYVTLADHIAIAPSSRWVQDNRRDRIVTTASDARLELDLTRAGIGKMVLPTFIGEDEAGLVRLSDPIPELTHDEWLVTHHDARHDPPVRAAIDAITRFIERG